MPGGARGGRASSGSAVAGATADSDLQPQQPPVGALLPIMEVHSDGSKSLLGTLAIISPDGMAITARNAVVRADGYIHPRRLWVADGVTLRHVMSLRVSNVSLFKLTRSTNRSGGSSSASSSGGGSVAVSAEEPWPHLEIVRGQTYDTGTIEAVHGICRELTPVCACFFTNKRANTMSTARRCPSIHVQLPQGSGGAWADGVWAEDYARAAALLGPGDGGPCRLPVCP